MSADWPHVPLREVLQLQRRWVKLNPMEQYREIGIRSFGNGIFHKAPVAGSTLGAKRVLAIQPGDLVFNNVFAWEGAVAVASESEAGMIGSHRFVTYTVNPDVATAAYLKLYFATETGREILLKASPGSAGRNKTLGLERFISSSIPLPPTAEQRRIVSRVDAIAAKMHECQITRQESTLHAEVLMASGMAQSLHYLAPLGTFGEIITFKPRSGPSFLTAPDGAGLPVLMPSSVTGFGVNAAKVEFGPGNEKVSPKDHLQPGDILIARGNKRDQVGNAGIVPEKAKGWVCANLLMRTQVNLQRVNPEFCIYWLRCPRMRQLVRRSMTGTNPNIQKINQGMILNFPFPTSVPLAEQRRIVAHLDALQAKADALRSLQAEAAAELDALLPAVLAKAFAGEL